MIRAKTTGNRREVIAGFVKTAAVPENVPVITELPEMLAAGQKVRDLEERLKHTREQICRAPESGTPLQKYDSEQDALKLIAGEELGGQSRDSELKHLRRLERGLEIAILIEKGNRRRTESQIIERECLKLQPAVMPILLDTISPMEKLQKCLERQMALWQHLSHRGLTADARLPGWRPTAYEEILLFGGHSLWSLPYYLQERKKTLGLDEKKE